jgi:hypothetical protein
VRLSNSFGAFLSFYLLLALAPRALASNLVINSVLRRNGIFFIVLVDTLELGCCSLRLNLSILLASIRVSTIHIEDQFLLGDSSWLLSLSFLVPAGDDSSSNGRSSSIFCGLILKHLTYCDGAAFVTQSETTELRDGVALLQSDGNASLDAADNLGEATCELRLLLLNTFACSLTLLVRYEDLLYCALVSDGVDVKYALVTL